MKKNSTILMASIIAAAIMQSCSMGKHYQSFGGSFGNGEKKLTAQANVKADEPAKQNQVTEETAPVPSSVTPESNVVAPKTTDMQVTPQKAVAKTAVGEGKPVQAKTGFFTKLTKTKALKHILKGPKAASDTKGGDKSWLVALLLCFFLGVLGVHRFYLGYTWQGVVQLLTLGGLGVWVLIDFIRIIIRDLEPKDGSYSD